MAHYFFVMSAQWVDCLERARIAQLEMCGLDLLSFLETSLFGHVLSNFLYLLSRLSGMVTIFLSSSSNLIIGASSKRVMSFGSRSSVHKRAFDRLRCDHE